MRFKYFLGQVVALLALLVLWPLLLVIALLVKLKMSDGPVLFRQQRVGQYGRLFTIYKFRTMPITPFSKWLRRYKLDELPQLWNVLIGDMCFVGPRPDVPGYADKLEGEDREILLLRPGITGPASLKYRDEEELLARQADPLKYNDEVVFPDKVRINRYYLHHWSIGMDIRMILATFLGKKIPYGGEII